MKCAQTGEDVHPDRRELPTAGEVRLSCPNPPCCTVEYREL